MGGSFRDSATVLSDLAMSTRLSRHTYSGVTLAATNDVTDQLGRVTVGPSVRASFGPIPDGVIGLRYNIESGSVRLSVADHAYDSATDTDHHTSQVLTAGTHGQAGVGPSGSLTAGVIAVNPGDYLWLNNGSGASPLVVLSAIYDEHTTPAGW